MTRRPPIDDRQLLTLLESGMGPSEAARQIGYPVGTVTGRAKKLRDRGFLLADGAANWPAFDTWEKSDAGQRAKAQAKRGNTEGIREKDAGGPEKYESKAGEIQEPPPGISQENTSEIQPLATGRGQLPACRQARPPRISDSSTEEICRIALRNTEEIRRLADRLKALEEKAEGPPPPSIARTGETVPRTYRIDQAHLAALEAWARTRGLTVTDALHRLIETGLGPDREAS